MMRKLTDLFAPGFYGQLATERRRWSAMPSLPQALRNLVQVPLPDLNTPVKDVPWLVFDFETSGLNAGQDHILSLGSVQVNKGEIFLNTAYHQYVAGDRRINARSATINHITPEMARHGDAIEALMALLFTQLTGRVAVVHGKMIESAFIEAWLQRTFGLRGLPVLWIDTLNIERLRRKSTWQDTGDLRLSALRRHHQLPDYPGHHALTDAVATAELLLAQIHSSTAQKTCRLKSMLCR